jgi:hypothetical protein
MGASAGKQCLGFWNSPRNLQNRDAITFDNWQQIADRKTVQNYAKSPTHDKMGLQ